MSRPDPAVVAELVQRTRETSGVPPTIADPVALARVAAVLRTGP